MILCMRGKENMEAEAYRGTINGLIGARLREARRARGLSCRQVAERVGVSVQMIQKYEYGRADIPISRFFRVCEALGVGYGAVLRGFASQRTAGHSGRT